MDTYLQALDRGEEFEGQRERGTGADFAQLSPWYTTPVDGAGVTHLQHQVHGPLTATTHTYPAWLHIGMFFNQAIWLIGCHSFLYMNEMAWRWQTGELTKAYKDQYMRIAELRSIPFQFI